MPIKTEDVSEVGPCPVCGKMMEVGDEDPILERICDSCAAAQVLAAGRGNLDLKK